MLHHLRTDFFFSSLGSFVENKGQMRETLVLGDQEDLEGLLEGDLEVSIRN